MSPATLVEDLKAAALYWEMNGGIVKETTLEWKAAASIEALAAERDALRVAMEKIDAIRNSIIGFQNIGWSEHIYPLVAALQEAGFEGVGYEKARESVRTLLAAEARAETAEASLADAVKALEQVTNSRDIEAQPLRGAELRSEEC